MDQKLKRIFSIGILFILLPRIKAAVTPTKELLKFFPLNSRDYEDLRKLIDQHSVVTENHLASAGYRSLADWSQTMPNGWDRIFKMKRRSPRAKAGYAGYPLCVLRAHTTKKTGRQFDIEEDFEYAGVAPNIDYTAPSYMQYVYEQPTYVASAPIQNNPPPLYSNPYGTGQNVSQTPRPGVLVNCIVVIRRYGKSPASNTNTTASPTTSTTPTPNPTLTPTIIPIPCAYPPRPGYPYPHPYPPPSPHYAYDSRSAPPPPHFYRNYPYPPPICDPPPEGYRDVVASHATPYSANSQLDSITLSRLGDMLNEYYQQLVHLIRGREDMIQNFRFI